MVANDEFCQVLAGADFLVESVVWADDVAIPVATFGARDLAPTIEASLSQVHAIFQRRGSQPAERQSQCSSHFQGSGSTGYACQVSVGVPTRLLSSACTGRSVCTPHALVHTLDQEIAMRIGVAKSAFAQVARPIQDQAFHR